jgi:acetylornithine deacetylase
MNTIEVLQRLVAFDTTSSRSNLPLIEWVCECLEPIGARLRVTRSPCGAKANLLASIGPAAEHGVVLSAHTDVVPAVAADWHSDPFTLTERAGRLHGRGTADMKGFIAACLTALSHCDSGKLRRPIHLALSYDEEIGCLGVPGLVADLISNITLPSCAIVGEPTGMHIGLGHRGFFGFRATFQGRAAHSSDPSKGASAIGPAADFVHFLLDKGRHGRSRSSSTTFNVGRIDGGASINLVPDRCEVLFEYRTAAVTDAHEIAATILGFLGSVAAEEDVKAELVEVMRVPPLHAEGGGAAAALAHACGGKVPLETLPFGSEAGFFENAGIPSVVCGPGSIDQAHRVDEWISIEQLAAADQFMGGIVQWARQ